MRDANTATKVGDYDVQAQPGGRVPGIELRSNSPGAELMHLEDYCVDQPMEAGAVDCGRQRRALLETGAADHGDRQDIIARNFGIAELDFRFVLIYSDDR